MNFISDYLDYVGDTEVPITYHRWCCISMLGAYLGRQYSMKFGHSALHSNMYIMLIGTPGARKSTAIKVAKKIITLAGYDRISADKSSKEKFLLDLSGEDVGDAGSTIDQMLDSNLWGTGTETECAEMFIACDEFNDFIGNGNIEFISMLGNLWDFEGNYQNRIKNGKSVNIVNPTISILGGNTPVNFARAFPPEILGQGFFSRLILIHGEPTGKRITFPAMPDSSYTAEIVKQLQSIKMSCMGSAEITFTGKKLLNKIYQSYGGLDDIRFDSYNNRRFTHLLKLCLILSSSRQGKEIAEIDIIAANTYLTHTEHLMPKAMGEFGKSRNSDTSHKVMQILGSTNRAMTVKDLWELVHTDMERINDLAELLRNLITAEKVFSTGGGFLAKKRIAVEVISDTLNYELLTREERDMS